MTERHSGEVLGGDLYKLLIAARVDLPEMVEVYLKANGQVGETADSDTKAFRRPEHNQHGESSSLGRVYPAWKELRDILQWIFGATAINLTDTATALERTVRLYASTDAEAAAELKKSIDNSSEGPDIRSPQQPHLPRPEMPYPPPTVPKSETQE